VRWTKVEEAKEKEKPPPQSVPGSLTQSGEGCIAGTKVGIMTKALHWKHGKHRPWRQKEDFGKALEKKFGKEFWERSWQGSSLEYIQPAMVQERMLFWELPTTDYHIDIIARI
jgi:hypothetical protein